jgi:hypothetical protein
MIKKLLFLTAAALLSLSELAALDVNIGVKGNFNLNWAWQSPGEYAFTYIVKPNGGYEEQASRRSVGQSPQMGGGVTLFTQFGFSERWAVMSEVGFQFRNGITYQGNVSTHYLANPQPGAPPIEGAMALTGDMKYFWNSIDFHLLGQFYPMHINDSLRFFLTAGPAFSFTVGSVNEVFEPGLMTHIAGQAPYKDYSSIKKAAQNLYNVGVTAGVGIELDAGPGFLVFDMRSTWYFLESESTYVSMGEAIKTAKPLVINVGYAFRLN